MNANRRTIYFRLYLYLYSINDGCAVGNFPIEPVELKPTSKQCTSTPI